MNATDLTWAAAHHNHKARELRAAAHLAAEHGNVDLCGVELGAAERHERLADYLQTQALNTASQS